MEENRIEHRAIYFGKLEASGGGRLHFYRLLKPDTPNEGADSEEFSARDIGFKKPLGHASIGQVVKIDEFPQDNGSRWKLTGYAERWKCGTEVMKWQAKNRTLETEAKNKAEATKNKYKEVDDNIDALRSVYYKLPSVQREAFLAWIISGVIRGANKKS